MPAGVPRPIHSGGVRERATMHDPEDIPDPVGQPWDSVVGQRLACSRGLSGIVENETDKCLVEAPPCPPIGSDAGIQESRRRAMRSFRPDAIVVLLHVCIWAIVAEPGQAQQANLLEVGNMDSLSAWSCSVGSLEVFAVTLDAEDEVKWSDRVRAGTPSNKTGHPEANDPGHVRPTAVCAREDAGAPREGHRRAWPSSDGGGPACPHMMPVTAGLSGKIILAWALPYPTPQLRR